MGAAVCRLRPFLMPCRRARPAMFTVQFTSEQHLRAGQPQVPRRGLRFRLHDANVTGTLAHATINYDAAHAGDHGSCVVWTARRRVHGRDRLLGKTSSMGS